MCLQPSTLTVKNLPLNALLWREKRSRGYALWQTAGPRSAEVTMSSTGQYHKTHHAVCRAKTCWHAIVSQYIIGKLICLGTFVRNKEWFFKITKHSVSFWWSIRKSSLQSHHWHQTAHLLHTPDKLQRWLQCPATWAGRLHPPLTHIPHPQSPPQLRAPGVRAVEGRAGRWSERRAASVLSSGQVCSVAQECYNARRNLLHGSALKWLRHHLMKEVIFAELHFDFHKRFMPSVLRVGWVCTLINDQNSGTTFAPLQGFLCGLQHRLVELLGKLLRCKTFPGFGLSVDTSRALFSEQRLSYTTQ